MAHHQKTLEEQLFDLRVRTSAQLNRCRSKADQTKLRLLQAATLVDNALNHRKPDNSFDMASLRVYKFYNSKVLKYIIRLCVAISLLLALCEPPTHTPLAPLPLLGVEAFTLIVFASVFFLKYRFLARQRLWKDRKNIVHVVVLLLSIVDMLFWLAIYFYNNKDSDTSNDLRLIRITRSLRPWFLIYTNKAVRLALRNIRNMVISLFDVLTLLLLWILLFTFFSVLLFDNTPAGREYFPNVGIAFVNLFTALTTVNFPDIMLPAMEVSKWWSVFFIVFMFVGVYLFMNFTLAVVYSHYRANFKHDMLRLTRTRLVALRHAFELLLLSPSMATSSSTMKSPSRRRTKGVATAAPTTTASSIASTINSHEKNEQQQQQQDNQKPPLLNLYQWRQFMSILRPRMSDFDVQLRFALLDSTSRGRIDLAAFERIPDLFTTDIWLGDNPFEKLLPNVVYQCSVSRAVRAVVSNRFYELFVSDALIVLNALFILIAFALRHSRDTMLANDSLRAVEVCFTLLFTLELLSKFWTYGPAMFRTDAWNSFDLVVVSSAAAALIVIAPQVRLARYILLLRLFRLTKVLYRARRFRVLLRIISVCFPILGVYLSALFCFYYCFAIVGMEWFGGLLYRGAPNLPNLTTDEHRAAPFDGGRAYVASDYFAYNFNSYIEAMIMLFNYTILNNWHLLSSGPLAVTGDAAIFFFVAFIVIINIMLMNIVIAFIVEIFSLQHDLERLAASNEFQPRLNELCDNSDTLGEGEWRATKDLRKGYNVIHMVFQADIMNDIGMERRNFDETEILLTESQILDEDEKLEYDEDEDDGAVVGGGGGGGGVSEAVVVPVDAWSESWGQRDGGGSGVRARSESATTTSLSVQQNEESMHVPSIVDIDGGSSNNAASVRYINAEQTLLSNRRRVSNVDARRTYYATLAQRGGLATMTPAQRESLFVSIADRERVRQRGVVSRSSVASRKSAASQSVRSKSSEISKSQSVNEDDQDGNDERGSVNGGDDEHRRRLLQQRQQRRTSDRTPTVSPPQGRRGTGRSFADLDEEIQAERGDDDDDDDDDDDNGDAVRGGDNDDVQQRRRLLRRDSR